MSGRKSIRKCEDSTTHPEHEWESPGGHQWKCLGVDPTSTAQAHGVDTAAVQPPNPEIPEQRCMSTEAHTQHLWQLTEESSFLRCPGITSYGKGLPEEQCGKKYHHGVHIWESETVPSNRYRCDGRVKMPEKRCESLTMHAGHKWSDDRGLNYSWCVGLDAATAALIHTPSAAKTEEGSAMWQYHVVPDNRGKHSVVKKRGDGKDPQWEKTMAEYTSPVYARIVADVLNGGIILGFEVKE